MSIAWLLLLAMSRALAGEAVDHEGLAGSAIGAASVHAYPIGAGDVVRVDVFGEEELSGDHVVGPGGVLRFPLIGEVVVDGWTAEQIATEIERRLGEDYLQRPQVTLTVIDYASKPVQVLGAVEKPGVYYLSRPTALLEMLAIAGDVDNDHGPVKEIHFRRNGKTTIVELDRLVSTGDGDVWLTAGDVVYVPEGLVVYVSGQVEEPGEVPYSEGLTVTRALAKAGGPKPTARLSDAYILRDGSRIPIRLRAILKGREPDVELEPGDQLLIEEALF